MFRTIVIGLIVVSTTVAINATQSSPRLDDTIAPIARRDLVESVVETDDGESTTVRMDSDDETYASRRMLAGPSEDIEERRNVSTMPSRGNRTDDDGTVDRTGPQADQGRTRLPLCCQYGYRLRRNRCIETNGTFRYPALYHADDLTLIDAAPNHRLGYFHLFVRDPCVDRQRYKLVPDENPIDAFMLLDNGSIYMQNEGNILRETDYCLGIVDTESFDVVLCFDTDEESENNEGVKLTVIFPVGLIVSVPFLLATFIVYTLIPEFSRSMHGRTLRGYVGSLVVAYVILAVVQISPQEQISDSLCIVFAFIIYFSFLASFFWLNVMCFDIWWTFGGFRSLRGSVMQRERKKFLIYSIYAWGCALILTGVCVIVDFFPDIPEYVIKPQFGRQNCWFTTRNARAVYFYGPMGVTVFCNICLFISTALKIVQHKKNTAQQLKGTDSRRHDDNKQWFNLYLKLFIVMGINWSMEIVSWLCDNSPAYIWYLTDLTNTLQGVIIFLIFVWKDKVKRLLLKRFGCRGSNVLSRTRSTCHSSAVSRTSTLTTQFQEKIDLYSNDPSGKSIVDN
ncbi:G-protein coupled receptor Mth2-like isoform X1 [Frieseomelitta varia]|uniref:G-protein coupled receptor Mth2-like isoform X1 n=1 Tax=Frieseomelitta varia TaxID=561572 RepID=UPI001CB6B457|nr:G-protein coupled receptor Mth2-like isoform X1 [Frieseomelitta varia]